MQARRDSYNNSEYRYRESCKLLLLER